MKFINGTIVIGLFTSLFYFLGYVIDSTLLRNLNLPVNQFIKPPEQLIHDGFLLVTFDLIAYAISTIIFIMLVALLHYQAKKRYSKYSDLYSQFGGLIRITLVSVFLIIFIRLIFFDKVGTAMEQADDIYKSLSSSNIWTHEFIFVNSLNNPKKYNLLRYANSMYAVYDPESKTIEIINSSKIESIKSYFPKYSPNKRMQSDR